MTMPPTAFRGIRFDIVALAAATADAAAQTRTVPDVVGAGDKTAKQIIADNPNETFAIVKKRPKAVNKVVSEKSPGSTKVLSVGEVIHLYVGGSGGAGEALEEAPILWLPIVLVLLFGGWALQLRSQVKDLKSKLARVGSGGDDA